MLIGLLLRKSLVKSVSPVHGNSHPAQHLASENTIHLGPPMLLHIHDLLNWRARVYGCNLVTITGILMILL
jgi:hypothetical protein